MALMSRAAQDEFCADLGLVQEAVHTKVDPAYAQKKDGHWDIIWVDY